MLVWGRRWGPLVGGRGAAFAARDGPGVHQPGARRAQPRTEERAAPLILLAHPPRIARFVRLLDPRRGEHGPRASTTYVDSTNESVHKTQSRQRRGGCPGASTARGDASARRRREMYDCSSLCLHFCLIRTLPTTLSTAGGLPLSLLAISVVLARLSSSRLCPELCAL